MKWAIGILVAFIFVWYIVPVLFGAMAEHDYDTLYHGMQDAKRAGGSFVQEVEKPYESYADRYAHGKK